MQLTIWLTALKKPIFAQLLLIIPLSIELESWLLYSQQPATGACPKPASSLLCSHQPTTGPYRKPAESSTHPHAVFLQDPLYIERQCHIGSSPASHSRVWGSNIRPDTDHPEVPLLSLSGHTLPQYYHLLVQPSISLTSNNPTTRRYIHCGNVNREQISAYTRPTLMLQFHPRQGLAIFFFSSGFPAKAL